MAEDRVLMGNCVRFSHWLRAAIVSVAGLMCIVGTSTSAKAPSAGIKVATCGAVLAKVGATCYEFDGEENWGKPSGRRVTLQVAVVGGSEVDPKLAPVFWFPGGPGGEPPMNDEGELRAMLAEYAPQPLVLIGQRGTTFAKPVLDCHDPGLLRLFPSDIFGTNSLDERIKDKSAVVSACYKKLKSEGVDVRQYTDYQIARDYDEIRKALGYEKINISGISAGGGAVLTYLTYYGPNVRSAVLVNPWLIPYRNRPAFDEIITAKQIAYDILSVCVRDNKECASRLPGYLAVIDRARAILDAKPYVTTVASETDSSGRRQIRIDGATFLSTLYYSEIQDNYYLIPMAIEAIQKGDYAALNEYFGLGKVDKISPRGPGYGAFWAAVCGGMGKNRPTPEETIAMIKREPALMAFETMTFCAWWGEDGDVPPSLSTFPVSDVPALGIYGQVDACCGISWTDPLAQRMPNFRRVWLRAQGHHGSGGGCRGKLIAAFLKSPHDKLDHSCKDDAPLKSWVFYKK